MRLYEIQVMVIYSRAILITLTSDNNVCHQVFECIVGHFVSSSREREKRDRRDGRGDEREGQVRKENE